MCIKPLLPQSSVRATTLAWWPDIRSVISLDAHGPNRLACDGTPYPLTRSCLIVFYLFISFYFKKIVRGHCPGLVTSGGNVGHKHFTQMRRLARDETPFLLAMPPRATTLEWWPDDGSFIPLDSHGPNRMACDETPYPSTRSCFIILWFPLFLVEKIFIAFSGIPMRSISRFYF